MWVFAELSITADTELSVQVTIDSNVVWASEEAKAMLDRTELQDFLGNREIPNRVEREETRR